jgi:trimeric autotransporter adhesin
MASAETNLGKGLASIANGAALDRVNSQLTAAIQSVLTGNSTTSGTSSSGSSSSTGSGSSAKPATAVGTAPLTTSTPLTALGIPAGASITVSAGGNTTTYASTGTDTVGDLMNAINQDYYGNAAVTASLNKEGDLVLTSKNTTDTITVGGYYASNIGFGVGHTTFKPTAASPSSADASSSSSSATSASTSKSSTKSSSTSYTTVNSESMSSAASLLSDSGVAGSIVDMLA